MRIHLIRRAFFASLLAAWAAPVFAQGYKLGACPERVFLTDDELAVAAAYSLASEGVQSQLKTLRGAVAGYVFDCASKITYAVCTDGLLFGIIDPLGAAIGGVAGLALDAKRGEGSLLGGLLGSGAAGLGAGIIKSGQCRRNQVARQPAADAILKGLSFQLDNRRARPPYMEVLKTTAQKRAAEGTVASEDAMYFIQYTTRLSDVLIADR